MKTRVSAVYQIQSIIHPERIYIGSSVNVRTRWNEHRRMMVNNKHHAFKLQRHFNKYGLDDLVFSIIEPCMPMFCVEREQYYIDTMNPYFNTSHLASGTDLIGREVSDETRKKISDWHKGRKKTPEARKISETLKGNVPWNKGLRYKRKKNVA